MLNPSCLNISVITFLLSYKSSSLYISQSHVNSHQFANFCFVVTTYCHLEASFRFFLFQSSFSLNNKNFQQWSNILISSSVYDVPLFPNEMIFLECFSRWIDKTSRYQIFWRCRRFCDFLLSFYWGLNISMK